MNDVPVRVVDRRVFQRQDFWIFGVLSLLQAAAVGWFAFGWVRDAHWTAHPVLLIVLSTLIFGQLAMHLMRWLVLPRMRRPDPMEPEPGLNAVVVTTFVPGSESIVMLEETLSAFIALDYPHDTWVLDEGDDPEVKALAQRLGVQHFSRKHRPEYHGPIGRFASKTKYGNVNAWLVAVGFDRYDFFTVFDPDHVPAPSFLDAALGYFRDAEVGYVQLPQIYYNQGASFVARGAAEETYGYYAGVQMAAHGGGWPIIVGCHHTHRMTALREVGGLPDHDADDLLITYLYRQHGWRGVYVPRDEARGITPVDWPGYLKQQLRWARSVFDVKLRKLPRLRLNLPWTEKALLYLHGLSYLQGVLTPAGLIVIAYLLVSGVLPFDRDGGLLWRMVAAIAVVQLAAIFHQRFFLRPQAERGLHWRAGLLLYARWPYLLRALVDAVLGRKSGYILTRKIGGGGQKSLMLFWPHALTILLLGGAWAWGFFTGARPVASIVAVAAIIVLSSLAVILSEFLTYPDPYDHRLWLDANERAAANDGEGLPLASYDVGAAG